MRKVKMSFCAVIFFATTCMIQAADTETGNDKAYAEDKLPISIRKGNFVRNNKRLYFTGPFFAWHDPAKETDRRGSWSQNRVYKDGVDRKMLAEFGFNTWQPIGFMSYFIMKKYYPKMLTQKWRRYGTKDYFRECEMLTRRTLKRLRSAPLILDFSDVVLFGRKMNGVVSPEVIQQSPWGNHFFPLEPSTAKGFEMYATMFRDGTKFILKNGGNPFLYELFNEPNYNGFCKENFAAWRIWLDKKYAGDIAKANTVWGTAFTSFDEPLAQLQKNPAEAPGPWVDWMTFISETLAGHLKRWGEVIRAVDTRTTPKYFTWQPAGQISSFQYRNAFNMTFMDFLDVMGTEYCGLDFGDERGEAETDNIMAIGEGATNDKKILGAALARAYARGRPIIDLEMATARYANGLRISSQASDLETTLWHQVMQGFSGTIMYSFQGRNWEWKTWKQAKRNARKRLYQGHQLLNPFNYPEKALFGLKRFREEINRLADIVLPQPRTVGTVGVLYLDHQSWLLKGKEWQSYAYWQKSLRMLHLPHDFVIAEYLKNAAELRHFKAVLCPNIEYCPPQLKAILKDYVAQGGVLIAGPRAFSRDAYGKKADESSILGIRFQPLENKFVAAVVSAGNALATPKAQYAAVTSAEAQSATVYARWQTTAKGAIYTNTIGTGVVYTLMFEKGDQALLPVLSGIFENHHITKQDDLFRHAGSELDMAATIDVIDRGDTRFYSLLNWATVGHLSQIKAKHLPKGNWHAYDAIRREVLLSPSGSDVWQVEELEKGLSIFLPTQTGVLVLLTKSPVTWAEQRVTSAQMQARAAQAIAADKKRLVAFSGERIARQKERLEQRTFHEVDPQYAFSINLRKHVNQGFVDVHLGDQKGGWTDQGSLNDARDLPVGKQTFYGVPYEIIKPKANGGKSAVVLRGERRKYFPEKATGIPVKRKAVALYFLHTAAWAKSKELFRYVVHYADGTSVTIPIMQNWGCADWWKATDEVLEGRDVRIAWEGHNYKAKVGLFTYRWKNPHPGRIIQSLDIVSLGQAVPIVVAITGLTQEVEHYYDPPTSAVFLLKNSLRDGWGLKAWGADNPVIEQSTDGYAVISAKPKLGSWGGIGLDATLAKKTVQLGEGLWEISFELNNDTPDVFGKIVGLPPLQFAVKTEPPRKWGKKNSYRPLRGRVDSDPKTWQQHVIKLGKGPMTVNKVRFQYMGGNPVGGVKIRNIYLRRSQ